MLLYALMIPRLADAHDLPAVGLMLGPQGRFRLEETLCRLMFIRWTVGEMIHCRSCGTKRRWSCGTKRPRLGQ